MTRLRPWAERPQEVANLLNPAFIAVLLHAFCAGYTSGKREGAVPFALPFLALPLCLDPTLRSRLPRTSRTSVLVWLSQNQDVRFLLPSRARDLRPYLAEAILLAAHHGLLVFDENGSLVTSGLVRSGAVRRVFSDEMRSINAAASLLGKWLAKGGDQASVLSMWGVTP